MLYLYIWECVSYSIHHRVYFLVFGAMVAVPSGLKRIMFKSRVRGGSDGRHINCDWHIKHNFCMTYMRRCWIIVLLRVLSTHSNCNTFGYSMAKVSASRLNVPIGVRFSAPHCFLRVSWASFRRAILLLALSASFICRPLFRCWAVSADEMGETQSLVSTIAAFIIQSSGSSRMVQFHCKFKTLPYQPS